MKRSAVPLVVLLTALAAPMARAGRVTFEVTAPAGARPDAVLWISGDIPELGRWSGAGIALARTPGGTWSGTVELAAGTVFEFKVTRGGWDTVEKDAHGGEIANRRGAAGAGDDTLRLEVGAWRDAAGATPAREHTRTGDVRRHPAFPSRFVPARDVLVWLPPGYDAQPERRYPVVIFHDGQNVFDGATSFVPGAEWRADETADRLVRAGRIPPCILVAVANTPARQDEYTADRDARHGGGRSDAYFHFLAGELVPFLDRTYRTRTDAAHTAVIGSSLGGLAALDLALAHPERFGLVGCVSPAVWWADAAILRRVRSGARPPLRVWLDIGTAEGAAGPAGERPWLDDARRLRDALVKRGGREGADLHYEEVAGARHDERAWAARLDRILEFLLSER